MTICKHEPIDLGVTVDKTWDNAYTITEVYCRQCGITLSILKELRIKENNESSEITTRRQVTDQKSLR